MAAQNGDASRGEVDPLARLRALCLALPGVSERVSHGEPAWFGRACFAMYAEHHHDERLAFWCAAPAGVQEALVASGPERFFRPPYVGGRGWLGVRLDVPVDWEEVAELVEDAHRTVARPATRGGSRRGQRPQPGGGRPPVVDDGGGAGLREGEP